MPPSPAALDEPESQMAATSWAAVSERVRRAHLAGSRIVAVGCFRVRHGDNRISRFLARLLRLPVAAEASIVRLTVTRLRHGERWVRVFGNRSLTTTQRRLPGPLLAERYRFLDFRYQLEQEGRAVVHRQRSVFLRLGPFAARLPRWLAPLVKAHEEPGARRDESAVSVEVFLPLVGLLLAYGGMIRFEERCS